MDRSAERIAAGLSTFEQSSGMVFVWEMKSGRKLCEAIGNNGPVLDASLSSDGTLLAVTQEQKEIENPPQIAIYEIPTAKLIWSASVPPIKDPPTYCYFKKVAFSPDSKTVIVQIMYDGLRQKRVECALVLDARNGTPLMKTGSKIVRLAGVRPMAWRMREE